MVQFSLSRPPAWDRLGIVWRDLEARCDITFFQSWSWIGCRVDSRFDDPMLLEGRLDGRLVVLGLFNRRRRGWLPPRLWLGETGDGAHDSIYMEHNGLLMERGAEAAVLPEALRFLAARARHVVLSGVGEGHLAAAMASGAHIHVRAHPAPSPWVDLAAVRAHRDGHLGLVSGNTRQQLRRALRSFADAPQLRRAASLEEARLFLDELARLHQRTWIGRGKPGAFAVPHFTAFHDALLRDCWPRGEIALLRAESGGTAIGYLYNFVFRGRASNYQSGLDYDAAKPQQKPGLVAHHLAISACAAAGLDTYDFLAGDDRYKTSLAQHRTMLHWIEMMPRYSVPGLIRRVRGWF